MSAIREGREDLSQQARLRQQEHVERGAAMDATWRAQLTRTEKLKSSLRRINDKIEKAKRQRNLLFAKGRRVQGERRISDTRSGLANTSAFEAFNRMAEKMEMEGHERSSAWGLYEAFDLRGSRAARQRREGRWTLRIDEQYRIAFKWTEDGAEDVKIIECR